MALNVGDLVRRDPAKYFAGYVSDIGIGKIIPHYANTSECVFVYFPDGDLKLQIPTSRLMRVCANCRKDMDAHFKGRCLFGASTWR